MEIQEGRWETPPWHCSLSEKRAGTLESLGSPLIQLNSSAAVQHPTQRFSEGLDDGDNGDDDDGDGGDGGDNGDDGGDDVMVMMVVML